MFTFCGLFWVSLDDVKQANRLYLFFCFKQANMQQRHGKQANRCFWVFVGILLFVLFLWFRRHDKQDHTGCFWVFVGILIFVLFCGFFDDIANRQTCSNDIANRMFLFVLWVFWFLFCFGEAFFLFEANRLMHLPLSYIVFWNGITDSYP